MPSTDSGESFLIRVDGLAIYHSGDNAFWMQSYRPRYMKEIDWLAAIETCMALLTKVVPSAVLKATKPVVDSASSR